MGVKEGLSLSHFPWDEISIWPPDTPTVLVLFTYSKINNDNLTYIYKIKIL